MAKELEVYRDWLGIKETARPLNYYQLLRLKMFEDDPARVRNNYRQMNAHVRKFSTGEFAQQSQELLNELAKAMLCLTDAERKREYDAALGRQQAGEGRRRTLEEILLASKAIDQAQLAKARSYAQAVGLEVRDALVQQKMATPEAIMLAYAESQGLSYVELEDVGVDERLVPQFPPLVARQHTCVPVMIDQERLLVASPTPLVPDVEEELRLRFNMPARTVLCKAASVNAAVAKYYPREAAAAPAPARRPAAKEPAAAPPAPPRARRYYSDEEKLKRRGMFAIIAFNITIMLLMFYWMFARGGMQNMGFGDFALALLVGLAAGGAAFVVTMLIDR